MGSAVRELLSSLPLVSACRECEREKARELRVSCSGETGRSDAVRDGLAWLQWHGCELVTGIMLEARGSDHANAKRGGGKSDLYFDYKGAPLWPRLGEGDYIQVRYARRRGNKERTSATDPATCGPDSRARCRARHA